MKFFEAKKKGDKDIYKQAIIDLRNVNNIMSEKQLMRVSKY